MNSTVMPIAVSVALMIPFIAYQVFYLILLMKLFSVIKTEFSIQKPWTVWLTLIPILRNLWWYYLIYKAKVGTEKTLSFYQSPDKSTAGFYWFFISIILFFATGLLKKQPYILITIFFIAFICYIIHGIKVFKARKIILKAKENSSSNKLN